MKVIKLFEDFDRSINEDIIHSVSNIPEIGDSVAELTIENDGVSVKLESGQSFWLTSYETNKLKSKYGIDPNELKSIEKKYPHLTEVEDYRISNYFYVITKDGPKIMVHLEHKDNMDKKWKDYKFKDITLEELKSNINENLKDKAPIVKVGDKVDVASYGMGDDDDMFEEGCEVLKVRERNLIEVRLTSDSGIVCLCEWRGEWVTIENLEG